MIPRFKPWFSVEELRAFFSRAPHAVEQFEREFARTFQSSYALSFAYGRSALYAFLKAMEVNDSQVVMGAYTCVAVSHAVVLSGNTPKFVDADETFNMNLDEAEAAMNEKTRAMVVSNTFGYPVDAGRAKAIARSHRLLLIQDCAHCFGSTWKGTMVCNEGDAAIFGLNISKQISSVFGGMLTTNDPEIYEKVKAWRDRNCKKPSWSERVRTCAYFFASFIAFHPLVFRLVSYFDYVGERKLGQMTKYYKEDTIDFPSDAFRTLLPVEARIGLAQLKKYSRIMERRREIARAYHHHLKNISGILLPPVMDEATYSHYVIRVSKRREVMNALGKRGVQAGFLIEYSIPELSAYAPYADKEYPNARVCARSVLNLPLYPQLSDRDLEHIVRSLTNIFVP